MKKMKKSSLIDYLKENGYSENEYVKIPKWLFRLDKTIDSSHTIEKKEISSKQLVIDELLFKEVTNYLFSFSPVYLQKKIPSHQVNEEKSEMQKKIENYVVENFFNGLLNWYLIEVEDKGNTLKQCLYQYLPSMILVFLSNRSSKLSMIHTTFLLIYNEQIKSRMGEEDKTVRLPSNIEFDYWYNDELTKNIKKFSKNIIKNIENSIEVDKKIAFGECIKSGYEKKNLYFIRIIKTHEEEQHVLEVILEVLNYNRKYLRSQTLYQYSQICRVVFSTGMPFERLVIPKTFYTTGNNGFKLIKEFLKNPIEDSIPKISTNVELDELDVENIDGDEFSIAKIILVDKVCISMIKLLKYCYFVTKNENNFSIEALIFVYLRCLYDQRDTVLLYIETLLSKLLK